jgi:hypothetical protein
MCLCAVVVSFQPQPAGDVLADGAAGLPPAKPGPQLRLAAVCWKQGK